MAETLDLPRDESQEIVVPAEPLRALVVQLFVRKGMFAVEAEAAASRLVEADLRGIHSHGTRTVPTLIEHMDTGDIDPRASALTLHETPAIAILDAGKGLGHATATKAMNLAIEKARQVGTGTVAVKKSQHFGAASTYVLLAVEQGMIGFCTTSTGPATVAAYGSAFPATANNPLAWGIPTRSGAPIVLDMSCAKTSWGKVHTLGMYGLPLPAGWALDDAGQETTDPGAAKTLLPAAGARGYGLALVAGVLAGPLVGRKMPLHKNRSPWIEASEHFFYAIDIAQFGEEDRFYNEIEATTNDIHGLLPEDGVDKVRLPGELEWERAQAWKEDGIPLHRDHVAALGEVAATYKFDVPW